MIHRLELKIPPVAVFLSLGIFMWALARKFPSVSFYLPGESVIADIFLALGTALGIAAILAFRRKKTTVHPNYPERSTAIVTQGIYRYTRNPMYLALAFLLAAWATKLGNILSIAGLPVFIAYMTRFQIKPEERILLSNFGSSFAEYMNSVRRWL